MPLPEFILRSYAGGAQPAQLTQPIGPTDLAFTITPTTGWVEDDGSPLGTSGPFTVGIDLYTPGVEKVLCSAINVDTGEVTVYVAADNTSGRGYDQSTPNGHVPGGSTSGVQPTWSAAEAREANQAVYDVLGGGSDSLIGVPIGTSIDFRGTPLTLPANFHLEDASAVSRTTYSACFDAITIQTTGTTTAASPIITGVPAGVTQYLYAGQQVTLANSAGAIYTIAAPAISSTSFSVTSGVGITAGTAGEIIAYPHGAGDGSTTFNLPDSRGRMTMGQGQQGTNTQPTFMVGQTGGQSNVTLTSGQIPTLPVTDPGHQHVTNAAAGSPPSSYQTIYTDPAAATNRLGLDGTDPVTGTYVTFNSSNETISATTSITITPGGGSHENKSPFGVATKIIRVT